MLSPMTLQFITDCAREFGVRKVWLFGSALNDEEKANDIDLAVEGLAPELFFKFYGRLFNALPKPVDMVDLSQDPPLAPIIRHRGVVIYESGS